MADASHLVIRFIHILSGVVWVGGIFLWSMIIAPALAKGVTPQVRGPVMQALIPRISRYFGIAGPLTILTGLWTMGLIVGFDGIVPAFRGGEWGIALGAALVITLVMLVIAFGIVIPAGKRMLQMMPKPGAAPPPAGPPPPEMMALGKRLMMAAMANMLLGTLALLTMVWAVTARTIS